MAAACGVLHMDEEGNAVPCPDDVFRGRLEARQEPEPPMTPEEEEQAPEDCDTCKGMLAGWCRDCGRRVPDGKERVCAHSNAYEGECPCVTGCGCCKVQPNEPPPPQPLRRLPYRVSYSVLGHLYEVALPGDASAFAVDGALIIKHNLGPVAGICYVQPMDSEEVA